MTAKEGTLHLQGSGRWTILRQGREPFELTSGDVFRVEVGGKLQVTRMGHLWSEGYCSVEGYTLRAGMRAAIGVEALPRKEGRMSDQGKLCRLPAGGWAIVAPVARGDHRGGDLRGPDRRAMVARQNEI